MFHVYIYIILLIYLLQLSYLKTIQILDDTIADECTSSEVVLFYVNISQTKYVILFLFS